ncbi:MAG: hypothetical protein ACETWQ_09320 [Phycisphaerae bacterium]
MKECSVCRKLRVVPGCFDDYKQLAHYHYRDSRLGPFERIFALKPVGGMLNTKAVGVIVYSMPVPGLELRNVATDNFFVGFDRSTQLALINKNIRCISRVIIEPRFRGLGLASRLVRQTMPKMDVPIIEAMAVMGLVNPFFEKAGMRAYTAKMPARCVQLTEAFSMVGIEDPELIDQEKVQRKLAGLSDDQAEFIERQINSFLHSYGCRRRNMQTGPKRMRYILSKLTARPVYYIWFNETISNFRFQIKLL